MKDVRILLVGDPGVGKTSLILSLVSEEFPEEVPAKAEEITIPADVTPEKVPTHIVDYSIQEQNDADLKEELAKANVICIVYAVDDDHSMVQITNYWLPFIRSSLGEEHKTPVVLVGNKTDLIEFTTMETVLPIMDEYAEVETCVECSAKTLKNISELFYYAQKAVLHPTAPLYWPETKELTSSCKKALTRIFKICDMDNDQILNDYEINHFQRRCFNAPLQPRALEDVKCVVRKNIPDGIVNDGLSQKGFLFLHTLFIQRGRHETTWAVLRKFGYDNDLKLSKDYLYPTLRVSRGCSTELTSQGYSFLSSLFEKYDEDYDGCVSPVELNNMFSTCEFMPWGPDVNNTIETNSQFWITKHGFLSQWTLTTLLDVNRTMELLAYLGYNYEYENQFSALTVTREKEADLQKKQSARNVFYCKVFGAKSVGKTSFLQGHLKRNLQYQATLNKDHIPGFSISPVHVYGQEKYLLLQEVESQHLEIEGTDLVNCDVACLMYDCTNPKSFQFVIDVYEKYLKDSKIPVMIVTGKADQTELRQATDIQPSQFCFKYKLPPPQNFSCLDKINRDIYVKLSTVAAYPKNHLKGICEKDSRFVLKVGLGVALAAGLGFLIYKFVRSRR